ncbi:MAG: transcriptional regulator, LuxR family [Pseudonocardiales bacterium]|nr:transcriptional regulator, LuxR family [Pseudonocardiales bacterium]
MADGRLGQLPRVLVLQAMAAVRRADWNVALPAIDEARRVATETRQVIWAGAADAIAGLAAAMRGEEDQAEGLAADAERVVSPLGVTFVLVTVQMARGAAALCAGRHVDAVAHLRRLFTAGDPAYHWTMRWWALADLIEAAVRAHQRELVEPLITKFEPLAARTPAFWLRAVLRHARALLAEDRDAEARGRRTVVAGRPDEVMLSRDQAVATRRGTPSCTTGTAVCARRTPSVRPSI